MKNNFKSNWALNTKTDKIVYAVVIVTLLVLIISNLIAI